RCCPSPSASTTSATTPPCRCSPTRWRTPAATAARCWSTAAAGASTGAAAGPWMSSWTRRDTMTEAAGLGGAGPSGMLRVLSGNVLVRRLSAWFARKQKKVHQRKLTLYICACCRWRWADLGPRGRNAIEVAERWVDGLATNGERMAARRAAQAEAAGESGDE